MRCQTIGCRRTAVWTWHVSVDNGNFVAAVCHDHLERTTPIGPEDRCAVDGCDRGASAVGSLRISARRADTTRVPLCYGHGSQAMTRYPDEIRWLDTMAPTEACEHA